jgi:hypothetical protein
MLSHSRAPPINKLWQASPASCRVSTTGATIEYVFQFGIGAAIFNRFQPRDAHLVRPNFPGVFLSIL